MVFILFTAISLPFSLSCVRYTCPNAPQPSNFPNSKFSGFSFSGFLIFYDNIEERIFHTLSEPLFVSRLCLILSDIVFCIKSHLLTNKENSYKTLKKNRKHCALVQIHKKKFTVRSLVWTSVLRWPHNANFHRFIYV